MDARGPGEFGDCLWCGKPITASESWIDVQYSRGTRVHSKCRSMWKRAGGSGSALPGGQELHAKLDNDC